MHILTCLKSQQNSLKSIHLKSRLLGHSQISTPLGFVSRRCFVLGMPCTLGIGHYPTHKTSSLSSKSKCKKLPLL